jgi:hypothetical protein
VALVCQSCAVALVCQNAAGGFVFTKPVGGFALRKIRRWLCSAEIPPLGRAPDMPGIPLALISRVTRTYDRRQAQECIG